MADIARIGFAADTSGLNDAKAALQSVIPPAEKAAAAADKVGSSLERAASGATTASSALNKAAGSADSADNALDKAAAGADNVAGALNNAAGAANNAGNALQQAAAGSVQFDAHVQTYRKLKNSLDDVNTSLKFGGVEALNFSRQLADIGVTAAMGMNPLMIALQQGPQLFDILQQKAVSTGATVGAVARAAGAQIWAAVAPLLPFFLALAAAVGVFVSAFALGARSIRGNTDDMTKGMGLTEKQLERVKKAGVDTAVTIGDTFFAFFDVVGQRLTSAFDGPLKWLADAWKATLDFITNAGYNAIKYFIAGWTGAINAVIKSWRLLPGAIGDAFVTVVNASLRGIQWLINKAIEGINYVINFANSALGTNLGTLGNVDLGQMANQFAGEGAKFGNALVTGFAEGAKAGAGAVDRFFDDVAKNARDRRRKAIQEAAGDADKAQKAAAEKADKAARDLAKKMEGKKPGFGQDERRDTFFKDMETAADATAYAMERERGEIGLTGAALESYRYATDLLTQAKKAGLDQDPEVIAAIQAQADAYGKMRYQIDQTKAALEFTRETAKGFFTDFFGGLRQGQNLLQAFGNAALNVLNKILDKLTDTFLDSFLDGILGGGKGGGIGEAVAGIFAAKGAVFGGGSQGNKPGVLSYNAKGNAFANGIVSQPTAFAFGKGGSNLGIMGEAGPEAILPLERGPDGQLGVSMYGGSGGTSSAVQIIVTAEEGPMFTPRVKAISEDVAVNVTQTGIAMYDQQMPERVQGIANDERAR